MNCLITYEHPAAYTTEVQACTRHLAAGVLRSFPTPPAGRPPTPPTDTPDAEAAGSFDFNVPWR